MTKTAHIPCLVSYLPPPPRKPQVQGRSTKHKATAQRARRANPATPSTSLRVPSPGTQPCLPSCLVPCKLAQPQPRPTWARRNQGKIRHRDWGWDQLRQSPAPSCVAARSHARPPLWIRHGSLQFPLFHYSGLSNWVKKQLSSFCGFPLFYISPAQRTKN